MSLRAGGDEPARDQPRLSTVRQRVAVQVLATPTPGTRAKKWQLSHGTSSRTIVPIGKPDKGYMLTRILRPRTRIPEVRRKPEVTDAQSRLKAFLVYKPIRRASFQSKRPFIEPRCHQGLIASKINHCSHAEWADQLASPYWSLSWHGILSRLLRCDIRWGVDGLSNSRRRSALSSAWDTAVRTNVDTAVLRPGTSSATPQLGT